MVKMKSMEDRKGNSGNIDPGGRKHVEKQWKLKEI